VDEHVILSHDPTLLPGGFPACPKQVINLIMEDGKRTDVTEVSWFRNTRTSQYCVRLNLPFLTQCFQSAKYFPCPAIVILAKFHSHTVDLKGSSTAATHGGKHYPFPHLGNTR
jgi:hypothetical protein